MSAFTERRLSVMGCDALIRVLDAQPDDLDATAALLADLDDEWSRFRPAGALGRLNADPRAEVPVPPRLARAIAAALEAARHSAGLVDPTLGAELRRLGYDRTFTALQAVRAAELSGPVRPAGPAPVARWRAVEVDVRRGVVFRPPGVELDLGGIGKGLAADLAVAALADRDHVVVSLGGDLVCGGRRAAELGQRIVVDDPRGGAPLAELDLGAGAAATSGVTHRAWLADGEVRHHLLDPATGRPANTGLVQVTALAPTGAEAERRAKHALLAGPEGARALLPDGGVVVGADGVRVIEPQTRMVVAA